MEKALWYVPAASSMAIYLMARPALPACSGVYVGLGFQDRPNVGRLVSLVP